LVHFLSSEHRPARNPGTEFYIEYAEESKTGNAFTEHEIAAVVIPQVVPPASNL